MPIPIPGFLLAAGTETDVVLDLIIVLGAAAFAVLVLGRLRVPTIPALILTGTLIGPFGLGLVPAPDALGVISHLAIVFLLFGVGLELHLDALRPGAARLLTAAILAVAASIGVIWPLASHVAGSAPIGLAVAMAFALSSTAVVLKSFAGRRELTQPSGRLALATLVVQDIAVIGMLAVLPMIARWQGVVTADAAEAGPFDSALGIVLRLGGVAALVVVGRLVLPRLLRESLRAGGTEALFLVGMAFAIGAAGACEALGFSLELGAFLAGFILADTPFQQELAGQVVPVRDLFLAVFFTTLGMNVDPVAAAESWHLVLAGVALLVAVKLVVIASSCWVAGTHPSTALVVGAALAHGGEFSLILLDQVEKLGMIGVEAHGILIVVVVVSLILMPAITAGARRLAARLHSAPLAPFTGPTRLTVPYQDGPETGSGERTAIVAGFGPVGQRVTASFEEHGITPVVIELNPETVRRLHADGAKAVLGDVRSETVLRAAGIDHAVAFVLTLPDVAAAERAAALARRIRPDLWVASRSHLAVAAKRIHDAGADCVETDEDAVGDRLGAAVDAALATETPVEA